MSKITRLNWSKMTKQFLVNSCGKFLCQFHCIKSVCIRSYSGPHFSCIFLHSDRIRRDTEYLSIFRIRRDTEYLSIFSPNVGKCRKNADQNNSEYRHFLCSVSGEQARRQASARSRVLFSQNFGYFPVF